MSQLVAEAASRLPVVDLGEVQRSMAAAWHLPRELQAWLNERLAELERLQARLRAVAGRPPG